MPSKNNAAEAFQLLTSFKAIFDQGSIVDAADVLGITQSATSKHLQKLRNWLDDELFVRTATGMEPTSKSLSIIERVENILKDMDALSSSGGFDPSTLRGSYVLATTDEVSKRLAPALLTTLSREAPGLRMTVTRMEQDYSLRHLETGKVNLVISVNWHAPDQLMQQRLFCDKFVCLMGKKHPLAHNNLSIKNYAHASHIMVAPLGKVRGFIDDFLQQSGYKRFVRMSLPEFSSISFELLGNEHIITLPSRVAIPLTKSHPLLIKKLPFSVPNIDYYVFWHRRFSKDHTNLWMRKLISDLLSDNKARR